MSMDIPPYLNRELAARNTAKDSALQTALTALEFIRKGPAKPAPDPIAHSWEAFERHINGFAVDARMKAADAANAIKAAM